MIINEDDEKATANFFLVGFGHVDFYRVDCLCGKSTIAAMH